MSQSLFWEILFDVSWLVMYKNHNVCNIKKSTFETAILCWCPGFGDYSESFKHLSPSALSPYYWHLQHTSPLAVQRSWFLHSQDFWIPLPEEKKTHSSLRARRFVTSIYWQFKSIHIAKKFNTISGKNFPSKNEKNIMRIALWYFWKGLGLGLGFILLAD